MGQPIGPTLLIICRELFRQRAVGTEREKCGEIETRGSGGFDTSFADGVARRDKDSRTNAEETRQVVAACSNLFRKLGGRFPDALRLPLTLDLAVLVRIAMNHYLALAFVDEAANVINQRLIVAQWIITGRGRSRKENFFFMLRHGFADTSKRHRDATEDGAVERLYFIGFCEEAEIVVANG